MDENAQGPIGCVVWCLIGLPITCAVPFTIASLAHALHAGEGATVVAIGVTLIAGYVFLWRGLHAASNQGFARGVRGAMLVTVPILALVVGALLLYANAMGSAH